MPAKRLGNQRVNFMIQPQVLRAVKILAKHRGTTYSDVIRQACAVYVRSELSRLKTQAAALKAEKDTPVAAAVSEAIESGEKS